MTLRVDRPRWAAPWSPRTRLRFPSRPRTGKGGCLQAPGFEAVIDEGVYTKRTVTYLRARPAASVPNHLARPDALRRQEQRLAAWGEPTDESLGAVALVLGLVLYQVGRDSARAPSSRTSDTVWHDVTRLLDPKAAGLDLLAGLPNNLDPDCLRPIQALRLTSAGIAPAETVRWTRRPLIAALVTEVAVPKRARRNRPRLDHITPTRSVTRVQQEPPRTHRLGPCDNPPPWAYITAGRAACLPLSGKRRSSTKDR
ncbi:hypothetical protein [Streptomyces sp. RG80]|uniref:hypothetical protein n=1 Tax=Streptomyces sp. RG80 TaxID=3157340 RepID=UPI00338F60B9